MPVNDFLTGGLTGGKCNLLELKKCIVPIHIQIFEVNGAQQNILIQRSIYFCIPIYVCSNNIRVVLKN